MSEIVFLVEDDLDGGYNARTLGESIFTQVDDLKTLRKMVRDAVQCHYRAGAEPSQSYSSTYCPRRGDCFVNGR
ncbi:hypothetical protein [Scytonema sp. NUACC26]|uniref:hypothetical protein n=1 Tax=Scytonema sp. NUACC26 TaxID=3140176 RepID=UPI0034DC412A